MIICQFFVDMGFNIAWLRGGHPLLNVGDLAMEASQSLGLLLEQLKSPKIRTLSTSMIIVFVSRLASFVCISLYFVVHGQFVSSLELMSSSNINFSQSLSYCSKKAFLLWTHTSSFTFFGPSKYHYQNASSRRIPRFEECH
jgi:hypothetical protein